MRADLSAYDHTHISSLILIEDGLPIKALNSASVIPSFTCLALSQLNDVTEQAASRKASKTFILDEGQPVGRIYVLGPVLTVEDRPKYAPCKACGYSTAATPGEPTYCNDRCLSYVPKKYKTDGGWYRVAGAD